MTEQKETTCLNCGRTDTHVPLIAFQFKGSASHICPQCLPVLIHKSQLLADKLPGMEISPSADH